MGGRYAGYRCVGFHDTHSPLARGATERALARQGREFPQRGLACDRTIHSARPESPRVRSFDRGYEGLYATLKISMPLYRRLEKNMQLLEFKCPEYTEELLL